MSQLALQERRARELEQRCYADLTAAELRHDVITRLRTLMTVDAAFFASVDPATLLFTAATQEEPLAAATPAFLDNEFGCGDVNKFTSLAVERSPTGSLDAATRGDRARSPRYRDILAPLGLGDELRSVLRTGPTTWGVMCLHREDGPEGFSAEDARLLARLAPHIAEGLRRAVLVATAPTDAGTDTGPGVVILEPDLTLATLTPPAEVLLAEIADAASPDGRRLPLAIYAVAARLQALDEIGTRRDSPRLSIRTARHWITLHASHLRDGNGRIVVVIEPSGPTDTVPVVLLARGLTAREAEIAQLVVRGYSTQQIVNQLHISRYTVQDHLKLVFDKIGVRSRREFVGNLLHG